MFLLFFIGQEQDQNFMNKPTKAEENTLKKTRRWATLLGAVLLVSVSHYLTPLELSAYHDVLRRLYYLPIFFGAASFGRKGGLIVAVLSAILYAPHIVFQWEPHSHHHAGHEGHLNKYIEISIFFLFAFLMGTVFDQLKRATEQLKHSYEAGRISAKLNALGQLSAGLAHEIRNPLAGVRSSLDVIEGECEESESEVMQEFLGLARKEIDRASRLIGEFLDFAKPQPPQQELVDMAELIKGLKPLISSQAESAGVRLQISCAENVGACLGDRDQIKQVLLNLLLNALQSAPKENGLVSLDVKTNNSNTIEISVADNGKGVGPNHMDRIFDPFFTTRDQGVGLGLSISYQIVEQHGGILRLETPGELGGATFSFNIPKHRPKTN